LSNKIDYQKVLNPEQLKAVTTLEGPVLVIAGAGSGKTRTLVYRVASLVERGTPPENVLLLTFTRKAAGEMLERAAGLADERCRHVSGGTFHSLAHRVLRNHANFLGFENSFTILDRADMEEVIQSLVGELQIDKGAIRFPKRSTLANILSKAANLQQSIKAIMEEEYAQFLEYIPQITGLKQLYRGHKKTNQLMDYDDLILFLRQLLSENEEIRQHLSQQYRYIMVDEYQDTNAIQADIVKWLAFSHSNIMVVGDDSQSIYSFRGANYKNMFDFPVLFPGAKIIKLEENYRSTQPILTFTNALMDQAREKYTKCLFTKRTDGEMPKVIDARTEPEQAMFICRFIKDQMNLGRSIKEMAILFRAAYHSFELELELTRQGIPFVKYGGFKFMESAHIKDLLGHLRVVVNRDDTVSWGRALRLIKNIGQGKSQAIINWMRTNRPLPWQIDEWPEAGKRDEGLKGLSRLLKQLSGKNVTTKEAVELVIKYYDPILREKFDDFPKRQKDLEQLIPMAGRYKKLRAFLDDLILEPPSSPADINPGRRGDCLTLSTVHSAKGLEWSVVFVLRVMEGYFPSAKSYSNMAAIEEERRLMYVAATRAKDQLIMCYPGEEPTPAWSAYGGAEIGYRSGLSSFIQALPEDVIEYGSSEPYGRRTGIPRPDKKAYTYQHEQSHPQNLRPGDRVNHPAFGQGVISRFMEKEKVEVLFRDWGRKLLHLGHTILKKV
jgi:DNA helicase-2/ATP-dependent DNA helicase PcrA